MVEQDGTQTLALAQKAKRYQRHIHILYIMDLPLSLSSPLAEEAEALSFPPAAEGKASKNSVPSKESCIGQNLSPLLPLHPL